MEEVSKELITVMIAALPISELRGAIPYAVSEGISLHEAYFLSVIGNLIPVIPLLFLLEALSRWLSRFPLFKKFFEWWFGSVERRGRMVERYGALGLVLFVAIPLPVTGAWTGSVAAILFKRKFLYAFPAICCGVLLAGIIVTALTYLIKVGIIEGAGIFLRSP